MRRGPIDHRPQRREVRRAVVRRRGAHGDEQQPGIIRRRRQIDREPQPSAVHVASDQFGQTRLVDRDMAAVEDVDFLPVTIDTGHIVAGLGQASAGDQSHVSGSDDGDFHNLSLSPFLPSMKSNGAFRFCGRLHQAVEHLGNGLDLFVVQPNGFSQTGKLFDQFAGRGHQAAQSNENAHNLDIDSNGRRRPKYAR